jgi:hypothetical protein
MKSFKAESSPVEHLPANGSGISNNSETATLKCDLRLLFLDVEHEERIVKLSLLLGTKLRLELLASRRTTRNDNRFRCKWTAI